MRILLGPDEVIQSHSTESKSLLSMSGQSSESKGRLASSGLDASAKKNQR